MNSSFELLSSMSPKITNNFKPVKKGPSILALKKYFRKSVCIEHVPSANESVVTISSTCSGSSDSEAPIEISDDSDVFFGSFTKNTDNLSDKLNSVDTKMSQGKYRRVQHWIDNVNKETSTFDDSSLDDENGADDNSTRGEEELNCDGSFKLIVDESISHKLLNTQPKQFEFECDYQETLSDFTECENLLHSLYGNGQERTIISPSSESRITFRKKITTEAPMTERPVKKTTTFNHRSGVSNSGSNFLKNFQKARLKKTIESPWVESLKRICDTDTDSDNGEGVKHALQPVRLNFENCTNDGSTSKKKETTTSFEARPENLKNQTCLKQPYSFLASLSADVPQDKCDPSALNFRDNFHQHRETLAKKLFKLYNKQVFENLLPSNTNIEWNDRLRDTAGKCVCKKITRSNGEKHRIVDIILSKKILDSADRLRDTLIHELCHAATWIVSDVCDGHGSFWKAWASRAMKTFPELPPIERCHDYVVKTKYSYKCGKCGHTIGRHTKSLDTESTLCRRCLGKYEVFVNKTTKTGETKSVPSTPKKPNQFAIFVKENYANYKTPEFNHGDVMKILGQVFSDLKVQNTDKS